MKNVFLIILLLCCIACGKEKCERSSTESTFRLVQADSLESSLPIIFQEESYAQYNCAIPEEIKNYILSHSDKFQFLDVDRDLKMIEECIKPGICPITCVGDFNENGKDDFAIILKYKGYKDPVDPTHVYNFLVIFNDYEEQITPFIAYTTGYYAKDGQKTVVFENNGILRSYLKNDTICNRQTIGIRDPDLTPSFVFWNHDTKQYEYLNYMDDNLCEIVHANSVTIRSRSEFDKTCVSAFKKSTWAINSDSLKSRYRKYLYINSIGSNQSYLSDYIMNTEIDCVNENTFHLYYSDPIVKPIPDNMIDCENYSELVPIAEIKMLSDTKMKFTWFGFYNKITKERVHTENPFSKEEEYVILQKCEWAS